MNNQQQQETKRTATQRIDDLERGIMALYQTVQHMTQDLGTIKEAIKLLGNKMDSIVKASQRGESLNDEVISKIMIENNIEELKSKVTNLVAQNLLSSEEEVTSNSFVVGREIDEKGEVANPRMQFVVSSLQEAVRNKFPGTKVGQTLELQEGKWKFEVLESYKINEPSAAPAEQEVAQEEKAETVENTGA